VTTFIQALDPYLPLSEDAAALLVLLIALPLLMVLTIRARNGGGVTLRPIQAYHRLEELANQAAESDHPIHVALGTGQLGSESTTETIMSLTVLDYVARRASVCGQSIMATTGDPGAFPAAQGVVCGAMREAGVEADQGEPPVIFYGPDAYAYAAGATDLESHRQPVGLALFGRYGAEGLWLAEGSAGLDSVAVGGAAQPETAALLQASLDDYVSGEELFAAGAYLHRKSHVGSLLAQDALRVIIALVIIGGAILASV